MKIVTWQEYTDLLKKVYDQIEAHDFDTIAGIGRGGSIIAAYLASKIGIPVFHPIFIRHVGRGKQLRIVAEDLDEATSLAGRVLLVDDWLCEGRAMKYVLNLLPKNTVVTTLVMFYRSGADFKPNFIGEYIEEEEREIFFPYDPIGA